MSVDDYLKLDFSSTSEAAKDLLSRVGAEAAHQEINLTGDGDGGAVSANLTPAMSGWVGQFALSERQGAINFLRGQASAVRLGGGVEGIVESIEEDALRRTRNVNRANERAAFHQAHGRKLEDLERVEREHAAMRAEEGDRDALVPSIWIDLLIPTLILIPESFINFDSFLKLWKIQAVALGLTIVVGAGIGISAFMIGKFIKAWGHYMRAYDSLQRARGLRLLGIGIALLVVALAAVGYARYRTVLDMIDAAIVMGMTPPNLTVQLLGLLLGNVLIFALGVAATYLIHDENPDFAAKTKRMQKQKREVESIRNRTLKVKLAQIDRSYAESVKKMLRKARLMEALPDYAPITYGLGKIEAKDKQVLALLQSYRTALITEIAKRKPDFTFGAAADARLAGQTAKRISLAEFGSAPISLYRC